MLQKADVLVVVPAFNEAASITKVLLDIRICGFDTLVVDDGSTDDTAAVARQSQTQVVSLPLNSGVGGALRCGFRYAVENGYSAIIQCDADGQHLSQHLDDLLEASNVSGSHMVIGSRFRSAQNTLDPSTPRRFAMWWLARVARFATGHPITDSTSGFRIIRQPLLGEFAQHLPPYYLGDTFEALVVAGRFGYTVEEIGVAMAPRLSGSSSASSGRAIVLIGKSLATVLLGLHFRIRRLK